MRRIDEKEILRRTELLSKIEPRQESIERAMMRARQALAEHKFETTGVWRTIMTSGWTKLVAAAVIIAGVLIGIKVLSSEQNAEQNIAKKEETPKQQVIQDSVGEKAQQRELKVSVELAQAEALYRAKDIAGLVAMLKSGEPETKAAVANYLAKIGDVSALEALKKLSEQWEGEEAENPFAAAVRQIEERAADETAGYEAQSKEETKGYGRTCTVCRYKDLQQRQCLLRDGRQWHSNSRVRGQAAGLSERLCPRAGLGVYVNCLPKRVCAWRPEAIHLRAREGNGHRGCGA
jgi:hypothetical protein